MSQNIVNEVTFLLHSFLMGIIITFVYDGFLILRRLIRHSLFLISIEDLIFWIACAIGVFYMLYEENNGILRWFAVFGASLGMLAYKLSISSIIVDIVSNIIGHIITAFGRILSFLLKPVKFFWKKIFSAYRHSSKKGRKLCRCLKNKLTGRMKLLKIVLCKR